MPKLLFIGPDGQLGLSDETFWRVRGRYLALAQRWHVGEPIAVAQETRRSSTHEFLLTNGDTGERVTAIPLGPRQRRAREM